MSRRETSRVLQRGAGDWFLIGMVASVLIASVVPDVGRSGGWLHLDQVTDAGVFALFFLHGMGLSTDSLKHGASRWKLHVLIQTCTYVLFPLWWWLFAKVAGPFMPQGLLMGFFYLAVLPSTVSSSVAMTALARGNVAAAVLNATLSTLLGVFLTPMLVSLMMGNDSTHAIHLGDTMLKIARLLLLPFVVGHVLRRWWGTWFARHKRYTQIFDRGVILLLVWSSFSDAVAGGLWRDNGILLLVETIMGVALFLFPMLWVTRHLARWLGFHVEDEIAAVFCGSKKTLASGMPMAKLLFGSSAAVGLMVLPIMFYHQMQLFVCTVMARRYAQRDQTGEDKAA